jgi:hypothetical protein
MGEEESGKLGSSQVGTLRILDHARVAQQVDQDSALIAVEDQSLPNTRENRARSVSQSVTVQHDCNQRR